jgi:hypothetical protein
MRQVLRTRRQNGVDEDFFRFGAEPRIEEEAAG